MGAREFPPEQCRAERRSVPRSAYQNLLRRPQSGQTAREWQISGETAIDDNAFRTAQRFEAAVRAECRVEDRKRLPFARILR
jgi:hypothetical protein